MGMFDYVDYDYPCPKCAGSLDMQSKDGECVLDRIHVREVNYFGAWCHTCKISIDFRRTFRRTEDFQISTWEKGKGRTQIGSVRIPD